MITRDLSRPISVTTSRVLLHRGECQFSFNEEGTEFCGHRAPYRFELSTGNEHSTCSTHAVVVRSWPNLTRIWTDRLVPMGSPPPHAR